MVAVELEDREKVQDELEDEEARRLERDLTGERSRDEPSDDRARRGDGHAGERSRERDDDALLARREAHVGRVHVRAGEQVVHRDPEPADPTPEVTDREGVPGLVDRDGDDLKDGERDEAEDV